MRRSGADCASGLFSAGKRGKLPRPAPRLRAGPACEVSFAGRSAVPRRGRCGPALLRKALRCSCRAVACGGPGLSCDSGRRPLVRHRWRHGCGGCLSNPTTQCQDASRRPRPPRSPRQRRPRSRTLLCPVVPREPSDSLVRPPRCRVRMLPRYPSRTARILSIRPCPPPSDGMAHPCQMPVHLPGDSAMLLASRKRHPDLGIPHRMPGPTQDFRLPSGLPVCRSPLRPCCTRAAQRWLQNSIWHHDSTTAAFLSPCAATALQFRFSRCHYLLPYLADSISGGGRDVVRQNTEVVTARRLRQPPSSALTATPSTIVSLSASSTKIGRVATRRATPSTQRPSSMRHSRTSTPGPRSTNAAASAKPTVRRPTTARGCQPGQCRSPHVSGAFCAVRYNALRAYGRMSPRWRSENS